MTRQLFNVCEQFAARVRCLCMATVAEWPIT